MPQKLDANTQDIAFDAMCVWEWVLENRESIPELNAQFEQLGTCQMRERSVSVVAELREAYEVAKLNGYEDCFDWEFVPWFMKTFVRFEDYGWVCAMIEDVMPEGRPPEHQQEPVAALPVPVVTEEPPKAPEAQNGDKDVFVIICRMLGGDEPSGTVQDGDNPITWDTYDTERDAQLEIIDGIEEHIRQFKAGERAFDEIDFCGFYVAPATLHPDGAISTEFGDYPAPQEE